MIGPYLLGLTGSIGMGKSTTAQMFADAGLAVWDADEAVHRLYGRGGAAVAPVAALFPDAIEDGGVSRERLKKIIAADDSALTRIEEIVHPLVAEDRQRFIDEATSDIVVLDVPLLFETGNAAQFDSVVVVTVPLDIQKDRVLARPDMTEAHFKSILKRQMPDAEKRKRADHVIETLTREAARADVDALIAEIREKLRHA